MSCLGATEPRPFNLDDLANPINGVTVYAGQVFNQAETADTVQIFAEGFHNGNGIGTQSVKSASWTVSDPTTLQIIRSSFAFTQSVATVRGLKPGVVTLSVTLNGVTGTDVLQVLPRIHSLRVWATPSPQITVGDTIQLHGRANDLNGDSIPNAAILIWQDSGLLLLGGAGGRARYVALTAGTGRWRTIVANDTASVNITAVAK